MNENMKWGLDGKLPRVEEHTVTKLNLLRDYLRAYIDRLSTITRETFKLTLVDGFAGGGHFIYKDEIIPGSPLIMLNEGESAEHRHNKLNMSRRNQINFEFKYRFVEKNTIHHACLKKALESAGHLVNNDKISVHNLAFDDVAEDIIDEIRVDQPRAGRSIFLLDQTGYSHVALKNMRNILDLLPKAEIILTFAMGGLINFLSNDGLSMRKAYASIELTEKRIDEIFQATNDNTISCNAASQRLMYRHIVDKLQTPKLYSTPFLLNPRSRRSIWFIHFSRHPTARNVMVEQHWKHAGYCGHFGPGSLDILGRDSLISEYPELFSFTELELPNLKLELLDKLPPRIHDMAKIEPVTVEELHKQIANDTAAKFFTIDEIVCQLHNEKEISILNSTGKIRSMNITRIKASDLISVPDTLIFPVMSRRNTKK